MGTTRIVRITAILALLTACSAPGPDTAQPGNAEVQSPSEYLETLRPDTKDSLVDQLVKAGVEALDAGDLKTASKAFNRALKFEVSNGGLHFLNALTYHLMAAQGDSSQLEYARVGYQLALKFQPSLHWAAYQLGVIDFASQSYESARERFAYAALYEPKSPEILAGLAAASYYAQDLPTALAAVDKLVALRPLDGITLRDAAMIYGAAGRFEKATEFARAYETLGLDQPFRIQRLNRRLKDWMTVHLTEQGAAPNAKPS